MPLLYEKRNQVGILTISRPDSRNAWSETIHPEFRKHFDTIEADDEVRCVILTGDERGGAFCAGADLKDPDTHVLSGVNELVHKIGQRPNHAINMISQFPKPVIAAVNGYAIGIGCIITYCCDLIVASDRAEWRLPQTRLGILPAQGGLVRLARWIGKGAAFKVGMGFPLKADEALRLGLAQWVVPHDELMTQAIAIAERVADQPPLAVRLTKESISHGLDIPNLMDAALTDMYRFMALELTEDKKESHEAWREKRKPAFKGR